MMLKSIASLILTLALFGCLNNATNDNVTNPSEVPSTEETNSGFYPAPSVDLTAKDSSSGTIIYSARIKQVETGRYLDAYTSNNDYNAVTRGLQNDNTQEWILEGWGGVYRIKQGRNNRYLDAYTSNNDYRVVTRTYQSNKTQVWLLELVDEANSYYRIKQSGNGRYLDAYVNNENNYQAITRTFQNNNTQLWEIDDF